MTDPILDVPVSPLRQRLVDDMAMRRFSRETQRNYVRDVGRFATFLGRRPDTATADEVRRFQVEQQDAGTPVPTMNSIVSALRFFFTRHCPRCQGAAARTWLAEREADLLPVGSFHVVFTLPAEVADVAFQNKGAVYDLLFRAASETMLTIAADPRHLGARIGITAVLHTWGSAMTHHPHVPMIVPGGGIALDGQRWISSRPGFLLPVRVLGKLFRRLFLTRLIALHEAGRLAFFGSMAQLADRRAFQRHLSPVRTKRWVVYAKAPFAGPEAVLAYLSRCTHRVAIANSRLIGFDETGVTFRYKDCRRSEAERQQVMTLAADEFIRRFLLHVLPRGFHRIRHYGLFAGSSRKASLALARHLLTATAPPDAPSQEPPDIHPPCPCCGGRMIVIETFARWHEPRAPPQRPYAARRVCA